MYIVGKELHSKSILGMLICTEEGFNRPVLKHGPRSLTCMRVNRVIKLFMQNESKIMVGTVSPDIMHYQPTWMGVTPERIE